MALHRPAERQLNRIKGTDNLVETADGFPIEILPDQKSGCDGYIVFDCCRCEHFYHQSLRLFQHNAPSSHIGFKSFETGVGVLRKSLCEIEPMGQQYKGTVRAQNLPISGIFKRHRKPLSIAPKGK